MSEEFNDIYISEAVDSKEYDYEGDMAKTQLVTIADAAEELHDLLADDENMPEWCQNKITKAMDYLDTVRDYMISKDTEEEPGDENPNEAVVYEDKRSEIYHSHMSFHHAMKQAEYKNKNPELAKKHDQAGSLHAKVADMHADNHSDASKHGTKADKMSKALDEGKAYGPTGVSYYVPSGHKDEVNPKTGEKYPERQKPGYKNPSEQKVDELKKSTLASYIKKASDDRANLVRLITKDLKDVKVLTELLTKWQMKRTLVKVTWHQLQKSWKHMHVSPVESIKMTLLKLL